MEPIRAKDATPEQIASIHKNLAQRKENRKIEIEINEAIQLASRKGRTNPHPTKTPVKRQITGDLSLPRQLSYHS